MKNLILTFALFINITTIFAQQSKVVKMELDYDTPETIITGSSNVDIIEGNTFMIEMILTFPEPLNKRTVDMIVREGCFKLQVLEKDKVLLIEDYVPCNIGTNNGTMKFNVSYRLYVPDEVELITK